MSDAIRPQQPRVLRALGKTPHNMFIDVTAGADPAAVDTRAIAAELSYGTVTVTALKSGLDIPVEGGGDAILIANANLVVMLDRGSGASS